MKVQGYKYKTKTTFGQYPAVHHVTIYIDEVKHAGTIIITTRILVPIEDVWPNYKRLITFNDKNLIEQHAAYQLSTFFVFEQMISDILTNPSIKEIPNEM